MTRNASSISPEDAEEYTQALGQVVAGGWRQVALGVRLGVPKALGISTAEWVERRLGGYIRMSIPERQEAVKELTGQGMSKPEIADVVGVGEATVGRDREAVSGDTAKPKEKQAPAPLPLESVSDGTAKEEAEAKPQPDPAAIAAPGPAGHPTGQAEGSKPAEARLDQEFADLLERTGTAVERHADAAPLTDEEIDTDDTEIVVMAAAVEEPVDTVDQAAADRWLARFRRMEELVGVLEEVPPELPHDRFTDMTVLSARDLVQRITAAAAAWVRSVNRAYEERINR